MAKSKQPKKKSAALAIIETPAVSATSPKMGEVTALSQSDSPLAAPDLQADPLGAAAWFSVHAFKSEIMCTYLKVQCGMALLIAKKRLGVKQGKRSDLAADPRLKEGWAQYLRTHCGLSEETARRWMEVASRAKAKLAKLAGIDLKRMLQLDLMPEEWGTLATGLQRICDGETMSSLQLELGLITGKMGANGKGGPKGEDNEEEEQKLDRDLPPETWAHGLDVWHAYVDGDDKVRASMDHWLPIIADAEAQGLEAKSYGHLPEVLLERLRHTFKGILDELPRGAAKKGGK